MTTTITLTPEQSQQLQDFLAEGRFVSVDQAIAHSIDLLAEEANPPSNYTVQARGRIREGIDASLRGELVPQKEIETFFGSWEQDLRA